MFFIYNSLLGFDSHVKILNVFLLTASGVSAFQRFKCFKGYIFISNHHYNIYN